MMGNYVAIDRITKMIESELAEARRALALVSEDIDDKIQKLIDQRAEITRQFDDQIDKLRQDRIKAKQSRPDLQDEIARLELMLEAATPDETPASDFIEPADREEGDPAPGAGPKILEQPAEVLQPGTFPSPAEKDEGETEDQPERLIDAIRQAKVEPKGPSAPPPEVAEEAPPGHRIVNPDWPSGEGPHIEKIDDDEPPVVSPAKPVFQFASESSTERGVEMRIAIIKHLDEVHTATASEIAVDLGLDDQQVGRQLVELAKKSQARALDEKRYSKYDSRGHGRKAKVWTTLKPKVKIEHKHDPKKGVKPAPKRPNTKQDVAPQKKVARPKVKDKTLDNLLEKACHNGWRLEEHGTGVRAYPPNGQGIPFVFVGNGARSDRALRAIKSDFRKGGLKLT